jgi:hypothetical protein
VVIVKCRFVDRASAQLESRVVPCGFVRLQRAERFLAERGKRD